MSDLKYTWIAADTDVYKEGHDRKLNGIIIHSTGGREVGDIRTLTGETSRIVSSHWYITRDGRLFHFVADKDIAYHAGLVIDQDWDNTHTIGIENEHIDGRDSWPEAQMKTLAKLVVALRAKHGNLPLKGHKDVAPHRKVDPVDFPWDKLSALVKAEGPVTLRKG